MFVRDFLNSRSCVKFSYLPMLCRKTLRMKFIAEHLPRIGSVSVVIEGSNAVTITNITSFFLDIEDDTGNHAQIKLPHPVDPKSVQTVCTNNSQTHIKLKVQQSTGDLKYWDRSRNFMMSVSESKWMRKHLCDEEFQFQCAACNCCLISHSDCSQINDMPSEFWAELMDYWHCHKPSINEKPVYSTGYNKLMPNIGELLVGESYITLNKEWLSEKFKVDGSTVKCGECLSNLGEITKDGLLKVHKWNIELNAKNSTEQYLPEYSVLSAMLDSINSNAARMLLLKGPDGTGVLLWVFAIGIDVTLSDNDVSTNVMKVFYTKNKEDIHEACEHMKQNLEQLAVADVPMKRFIRRLEATNAMLPTDSQRMDFWNLSYVSFK